MKHAPTYIFLFLDTVFSRPYNTFFVCLRCLLSTPGGQICCFHLVKTFHLQCCKQDLAMGCSNDALELAQLSSGLLSHVLGLCICVFFSNVACDMILKVTSLLNKQLLHYQVPQYEHLSHVLGRGQADDMFSFAEIV